MDTVNEVLKILDEAELEQLKKSMLKVLFERKVLHKWKLLGEFFTVAVDGTGVHSYNERHCDQCLTRCYKSLELTEENFQSLTWELGDAAISLKPLIGKTFKKKDTLLLQLKVTVGENYTELHKDILLKYFTLKKVKCYFHHVLEAKLIGQNGFSISLGTEWIENPNEEFDKQDCEIKAFKRLAEKLKQDFPRLPRGIVADGLYPNEPFFSICESNSWGFIGTFKEGSLPTLREEIIELKSYNSGNQKEAAYRETNVQVIDQFAWINQLDYRGTIVSWVQCVESQYDSDGELLEQTRFEYLSSEPITDKNVQEIVMTGRLRQKIENEGFNTQKNLGYNLKHKYSRTSLRASKNYYQCMQIAHMINQLFELSTKMQDQLTQWRTTLKHCWKALMGFMQYGDIEEEHLNQYCQQRTQFRYRI